MARHLARRPRSRVTATFVAVALVVASVVCLVPLPSRTTAATTFRLLLGRSGVSGQVAVTGNSVMSHVSVCDADRRQLPAMIADRAGRPVWRLDRPGQGWFETVDNAALALRRSDVADVMMFVSLFQLAATGLPDLREQAFFRMAAGDLAVNDLGARGWSWSVLSQPGAQEGPFTYEGVTYPDYGGIKQRYFSVEKSLRTCPETLGHDLHFIEAAYWNSYVQVGPQPNAIADLVELQQRAAQAGKRLHVVLLPVDTRDVASLEPALAQQITANARRAVGELRRGGVNVLDLTDAVEPAGFADRWCACGHLGERGRDTVATRVSAVL